MRGAMSRNPGLLLHSGAGRRMGGRRASQLDLVRDELPERLRLLIRSLKPVDDCTDSVAEQARR